MSAEEFVLSILAMVLGGGVLLISIRSITSVINNWLNRGKSNIAEEDFTRLAKAFIQHKKEMEKRMKRIESGMPENQAPEVELPELDSPESEYSLQNDLKKKRRTQ